MKKSKLEQKLIYKSLGYLQNNDSILEYALQNPSPELTAKFKIKNVCASLNGELVERLENTLGLLRMTKREFLEAAIVEALDKADEVMQDCGVFEYLDAEARAIDEHEAKVGA